MQNFVHLHNHDEYSVLDGYGKSEDYAKKAKELGFTHLSMNNHGNIDGLITFQKACNNNGIKPIFGCEAYIVKDLNIKEKGDKRKHINILIKNEIGWQNLLKLLSIANIEGFYYRPRIDPKVLKNNLEGLIITTACTSSFILAEWGFKLMQDIYYKLEEDFYFEIMPHELKEQVELNKYIMTIRNLFPKSKIIATNDCHYIEKHQHLTQEVLLAIQARKKWNDKDRWKLNVTGLYLRGYKEMVRAFIKQNCLDLEIILKALKNTNEIAEKCENFYIKETPVNLPKVPILKKEKDEEALKRLCDEGFTNKIKYNYKKIKKLKEYEERYNFELNQIIKQGFAKYFLIVWELVNWCKNNNIMVGAGRGSSGGSLICYLLNITAVDPLEFDLIFARFISPARIDLPDIDMDFEDRKRILIRKHLEKLYGKYNVAGVSTFSRMKGKGAVRDVSRVFDINLFEVNKACECIVTRSGGDERANYTIEDAFSSFEDGKKFKKKYPKVTKLAIELEGQIRHKGVHAAAMCISKDDLRKGFRTNLQIGKDGEYIVNWEKYDIEHNGIMKLDVLGLNALTVLSETKRLVKLNHNIDLNFENLNLDDKRCYEEFSKGNTIGCFQVGSLGLAKYCKQLGIENFDMLVNATSLYRPGTLRNGMATEFIKRKKGEVKTTYIHPILKELTKETYGIILYQEQVMRFMYDLAGLGWRTCDTVRKVISKSQGDAQFMKFKKDFAEGCVKKNTLDKETAEKLWDELSSFGSYSFNKSHAVEYSMITYWDMYCKVHFPKEFICASLSFCGDDKKQDLIKEALRINLDIRPPKVEISKAKDWIIKEDVLYAPFIEIKGLGEKTCKLAEEYRKKYNNEGFFENNKKKKEKILTKRFVNILEEINAFSDVEIDDDFAEKIEKYFQFSFVKDPSRKYTKILEILNLKLSKLSDINFNKNLKEKKYYFVKITEIRFSYKNEKSGGMVYGYVDDRSSNCMIIFNRDLYDSKKEEIEHAAEKYAIIEVNSTNNNFSAVNCSNIFFEEDLINANFKGLKLNLIKSKRYKVKDIIECKECDLHKE